MIAKVEPPGAGSWFIRALCYDKLHQIKPALEAYQKFLISMTSKNSDQVWQAKQRTQVLRHQLEEKRTCAMSAWHINALVLIAAATLAFPPSGGAQKASDLQARFDHETNSVHKAKLFEHLGDEQLADARHASQSHDYKAVG